MVQKLDPLGRKGVYEAALLGVTATSMWVTTRHRNAWNATTSKQYRGPISLEYTLPRAKRVAENWRAQGSSFVILETPVVILETDIGPLACADFHTSTPFASWTGTSAFPSTFRTPANSGLAIGTPVRHAARALGEFGHWGHPKPKAASLIQGQCAWQDFPEVSETFHDRRSIADGSRSPLKWRVRPAARSAAGIQRIVTLFREVNGEAAIDSGQRKYLERRQERETARAAVDAAWGAWAALHNGGPTAESAQLLNEAVEARRAFLSEWLPLDN